MNYTWLLFIIGIILSCSSNNEGFLPGYSGNAGEVVVVMDAPYLKNAPGLLLENVLSQPQWGLAQAEPVFTPILLASKGFKNIFRTHRNIILAIISDSITAPVFNAHRNKWSKGQLVIYLKAPDEAGFIQLVNERKTQISDFFSYVETERLIEKNKEFGQHELSGKICSNHNVNVLLQKDCYMALDTTSFVWIRNERERNKGGYAHQVSLGVILYYYPYTDTSAFRIENLLSIKDSLTKKYITGTANGSYMTTSYKLILPESRILSFKKNYAVEIRGLWRMEGDFMGGPFYLLAMLDEKKQRIVIADGYVFAPEFDKLEYLLEVEAMVKSLEVDTTCGR